MLGEAIKVQAPVPEPTSIPAADTSSAMVTTSSVLAVQSLPRKPTGIDRACQADFDAPTSCEAPEPSCRGKEATNEAMRALETENAKLDGVNKGLLQEVKTLTGTLDKMQSEKIRLARNNDKAQSELNKRGATITRLSADLKKRDESAKGQQAEIRRLEAELAKVRKESELKDERLDGLRVQLKESLDQVEELKTQLPDEEEGEQDSASETSSGVSVLEDEPAVSAASVLQAQIAAPPQLHIIESADVDVPRADASAGVLATRKIAAPRKPRAVTAASNVVNPVAAPAAAPAPAPAPAPGPAPRLQAIFRAPRVPLGGSGDPNEEEPAAKASAETIATRTMAKMPKGRLGYRGCLIPPEDERPRSDLPEPHLTLVAG